MDTYGIIKATTGENILVDVEDYVLLNRHNWYVKNGYAVTILNGKSIYMHRLVFGLVPSGMVVDHKDMDKLNNQKSNLRLATHKQNAFNNTGGVKGRLVGVKKRLSSTGQERWYAKCNWNDKEIHIGVRDTEKEAGILRDAFVYRLRGEFAFLNYPDLIPYYEGWEPPNRLKKYL